MRPSPPSLICEGAGDEAIADDDFAGIERGLEHLFHHLGAGGHVEEHFATHGHLGVGRVEEDGSAEDLFADAGGARVADEEDGAAEAGEFLLEQTGLGGFAGAFGAIEDEECAGIGHEGNDTDKETGRQ